MDRTHPQVRAELRRAREAATRHRPADLRITGPRRGSNRRTRLGRRGRGPAAPRGRPRPARARGPGRARCRSRSPRPARRRPGAAAGVRRQLAQQPVRAPAADEVDDRTSRPDRRAAAADGPGERGGEAVEDAADDGRPGQPAGRLAADRAQPVAIRAGMSPGGRNGGVVGVDHAGRRPGAPRRRAGARPARSGVPPRSHVRIDSWSSQSPITLRRKRTRPSTPPSFVKFAARLGLGQDRGVELDADEAPGPARDPGGVVVLGRDGDDRRGGVVRADERDRRTGGQPGRGARRRRAAARAARPAAGSAGSSPRPAGQLVDRSSVPLAASPGRAARSSRRSSPPRRARRSARTPSRSGISSIVARRGERRRRRARPPAGRSC